MYHRRSPLPRFLFPLFIFLLIHTILFLFVSFLRLLVLSFAFILASFSSFSSHFSSLSSLSYSFHFLFNVILHSCIFILLLLVVLLHFLIFRLSFLIFPSLRLRPPLHSNLFIYLPLFFIYSTNSFSSISSSSCTYLHLLSPSLRLLLLIIFSSSWLTLCLPPLPLPHFIYHLLFFYSSNSSFSSTFFYSLRLPVCIFISFLLLLVYISSSWYLCVYLLSSLSLYLPVLPLPVQLFFYLLFLFIWLLLLEFLFCLSTLYFLLIFLLFGTSFLLKLSPLQLSLSLSMFLHLPLCSHLSSIFCVFPELLQFISLISSSFSSLFSLHLFSTSTLFLFILLSLIFPFPALLHLFLSYHFIPKYITLLHLSSSISIFFSIPFFSDFFVTFIS